MNVNGYFDGVMPDAIMSAECGGPALVAIVEQQAVFELPGAFGDSLGDAEVHQRLAIVGVHAREEPFKVRRWLLFGRKIEQLVHLCRSGNRVICGNFEVE